MTDNYEGRVLGFLKKHYLKIAFISVLILIAIPLIEIISFLYIRGMLNNYANQIANTTGISQYLLKSAVLILLIPLLLSFRQALDPLKWKSGFIIISIYTIIFYLSMYAINKTQSFNYIDGRPMKYYSIGPDGKITYYEGKGHDTSTGKALKELSGAPTKKVEGEPALYFDPLSKEPLCFYYESEGGLIELYDQPGYHPRYSTELKVITPDIVKRYEKQLAEKKKKKEKEIKSDKDPIQTCSGIKKTSKLHIANVPDKSLSGFKPKDQFVVREKSEKNPIKNNLEKELAHNGFYNIKMEGSESDFLGIWIGGGPLKTESELKRVIEISRRNLPDKRVNFNIWIESTKRCAYGPDPISNEFEDREKKLFVAENLNKELLHRGFYSTKMASSGWIEGGPLKNEEELKQVVEIVRRYFPDRRVNFNIWIKASQRCAYGPDPLSNSGIMYPK